MLSVVLNNLGQVLICLQRTLVLDLLETLAAIATKL